MGFNVKFGLRVLTRGQLGDHYHLEPVFGFVGELAGDLAWLEGAWVIGSLRRVSTCGIVTQRVPLRVGHGS